jgi:uncharacterized protein
MTVDGNRLILEAVVTTASSDDSMHVAPMGPEVDEQQRTWILKPFQSSTTYSNLRRTGRCVVHVVDDSVLIAKAVLGQANSYAAKKLKDDAFILEAACHWFALRVIDWDVSNPRAIAHCEVVENGNVRPFFGWNRAKHAIVEMAILASRVHLLDSAFIKSEIERFRVLVDKTAGDGEREAFGLLVDHLEQAMRAGT